MALGSLFTVGGVSGSAFSFLGIVLMFVSEVVEAGRCVLTQYVLKDCKFSVIEGLYYMAPASLCSLLVYAGYYEWGAIFTSGDYAKVLENPQWFIASGLLGIAVNFVGFLVIQSTSALFVKMLVTARNAGLVLFSVLMFDETVTATQLLGYSVTLVAFARYNYCMLPKVGVKEAVPVAAPPPKGKRTSPRGVAELDFRTEAG
jgi:drug/metabolite transporter (DMT)-like permease